MPMLRNAILPLIWISLLAGTAAKAAGTDPTTANPGRPNLGVPIRPNDFARWDIEILADGTGLPPGEGTAAQGAPIFAEKCSACHGDGGRGTAHQGFVPPHPPAGPHRPRLGPGADRFVRQPVLDIIRQRTGRVIAVVRTPRHGLQGHAAQRIHRVPRPHVCPEGGRNGPGRRPDHPRP